MDSILVLNAGSSSLKFALFPLPLTEKAVLSGQIEGIGAEPMLSARTINDERYREAVQVGDKGHTEQHSEALAYLFRWLEKNSPNLKIVAAGHRVVHGGELYSAPTRIDAETLKILHRFEPLAPLHQPHNLRAIEAVEELMPAIPQVGCFDTAFHRTQPAVAQAFGLPRAISAEGVKRYGFHGLSYDYVSRRMGDVIGEDKAKGAVVIAHLGNGASLCGLRDKRSMASTMGFTAVEGLMMGTRTGTLDPGVLLYLIEEKGMDAKALTNLIYKESGLLGVSGISQDMRTLLASPAPEATEAVTLFCYRIARELGSMAAAAGGLDALIFTGGIGENAAPVRALAAEFASWMGIELSEEANNAHAARIESKNSKVVVAVIPTNEEAMIARYTVEVLGI